MPDYINAIKTLINQLKDIVLGIIGVVTVLMVALHSIKYIMGDTGEKSEAISNIKKTLIMGGGIFFLIWFASLVIDKFEAITP